MYAFMASKSLVSLLLINKLKKFTRKGLIQKSESIYYFNMKSCHTYVKFKMVSELLNFSSSIFFLNPIKTC